LRNGDWVLLDEINLASSETLQRLNSLLDGKDGSVLLAERGDVDMVTKQQKTFLSFDKHPTSPNHASTWASDCS
jgi:midasin (ATPase involved in ribosome maturation)